MNQKMNRNKFLGLDAHQLAVSFEGLSKGASKRSKSAKKTVPSSENDELGLTPEEIKAWNKKFSLLHKKKAKVK
jgi:hypothetical protein